MNGRSDSENQASEETATDEAANVPIVTTPASVPAPSEAIEQPNPTPIPTAEIAPTAAPQITIINQQGGAGGASALNNPALLAASGALGSVLD